MRIVSQPALLESPATSSIFSRTHLTFALNSKCHEPASCSIACFTDRLVVSGPGVNRSLSRMADGFGGGCMDDFQRFRDKAAWAHAPSTSPRPHFLPKEEIQIILSDRSTAPGDVKRT